MPNWHTVAPLHNLSLPSDDFVARFGRGVVLARRPDWLLADSMVGRLGTMLQEGIRVATCAFCVEYEAAALGAPDPEWQGQGQRSIQESKYELLVLGNLALWLAKPSPACFTAVVHAPEYESGPLIQRTEQHNSLLCHRNDAGARLALEDIDIPAGYMKGSSKSPERRQFGPLPECRGWASSRMLRFGTCCYGLHWRLSLVQRILARRRIDSHSA